MSEEHPLTQAIIAGRRKEVPGLVKQCLAAGEKARDIVENRLVPGMMAVGEKFKRNEIFVPEMLIAARAMKEALMVLEPLLVAAGREAGTHAPSSGRWKATCTTSARTSSR